jgi:hypothetical protein
MRAVRLALACVAALLCGVVAVPAQDRPYQSLFGGAGTDAGAKDLMDFSFSLAEAYDTSVLETEGGANRAGLQLGGFFTAFSGDLRYTKRGRRAEVAVNAGTNLRYFQDLHEFAAVGHYAGAGVSLPVGRRTTLVANQAVSYRPSYLFGLFAKTQAPALGEVMPAASNYALNDRPSYTSVTSVSLRRRVGRRASVDLSSGYRRTISEGRDPGAPDLVSYNAGGAFAYPLGRDAVLRLGYTYRHAEYGTEPRPSEHDIALGVDYDRPLSRSRRTRLAFSGGSSLVEGPLPGVVPNAAVKHLRATANVRLTHQMGRTWSARAAYRRGADFVEEFSGPVFTDGVTVSMDGFLNRRTDVSTSLAYTAGAVFDRAHSDFKTYTGNARIRFGVTRTWATFAEYVYYNYDFAAGVPLVSNLPPRVSRHGARVGLMLWLPVVRN